MKKLDLHYYSSQNLRYGENPHQKGWVWQEETQDPLSFYQFKQIQGKPLSFNNHLDVDAVVECLCFIGQKEPTCVVVKHTNPCGASVDNDIKKAFIKAWNGDSLAAFGGIIAVNRNVSSVLAKLILKGRRFFEVLVCPSISTKASGMFSAKKNLRVLVNPFLAKPKLRKGLDFKHIRGGVLVQERNNYQLKKRDLKVVTRKKPTKNQVDDLLFAWKICHVSKANAITLAKDRKLISSSVGQQDRFRCCQLAISKAGKSAINTVAASDAFFPFPDGPEVLIKSGVKSIIQPGGSIRDQQTIDLCNKHNIAMIFTGIRCFKH